MKHGIDKEIECHSLLPCKCQDPILRYYDRQAGKNVAVPTTFDAPEYRDAWQSFLRDFVKHNKEKGWDKLLVLCPYDEPTDPETFRRTANMAKEAAPDIRITAAIQSKVANELADVIDIATLHLRTGYDRAKRDELRNAGVELRWEALKTGVEDVKLLAGVINDPDTSEETRDKLWKLARRIGKDEAISPPNDILVWRNELFEIIAS